MPHLLTTEAVLGIAQEFIKSSSTFAFDGIEETLSLELVGIRETFPEQYVIEADFDSLHGGYGDRTDQMVIQVITPHTMNLVVINGEVTLAILDDGKWNELNQLQLPWTPTKGPNQTTSQEFHVVDLEDATSSYMDKIIPTLDDFRNTLNESQDIETIFFKFGDPHDDIGSGIHIYVYELNDYTQIWIGYTDNILYVYHVDSDGNILEQLLK